MKEATKLQNVRLLFPNKKSLPWPVPLWSKYLVFTVSLPQPQYWGRSLSYQISNTAASSRSRHHHNHFQYGESVKSGAVEIPHDTCRCRCRKHWTTWVLKTERMIYLQIRLELQLYTLALMGYTFYLSSVKTWFYTASHSSAWIWLDDCSVYKFKLRRRRWRRSSGERVGEFCHLNLIGASPTD